MSPAQRTAAAKHPPRIRFIVTSLMKTLAKMSGAELAQMVIDVLVHHDAPFVARSLPRNEWTG